MQHYCRGCASLRQRGYKKSLTLRDLRHAMHVQGNAPPGRDFLDVAVRIKAATMAAHVPLTPNGEPQPLPTLPESAGGGKFGRATVGHRRSRRRCGGYGRTGPENADGVPSAGADGLVREDSDGSAGWAAARALLHAHLFWLQVAIACVTMTRSGQTITRDTDRHVWLPHRASQAAGAQCTVHVYLAVLHAQQSRLRI